MTHIHSNTKKRKYTHLTDIERGQIAAYIEQELSYREIAEKMGRDVSTISREVKRGSVQQMDTSHQSYTKYFPDVGARVYEKNRRNCGSHSTIMEAWDFLKFADDKILTEKWSPDAAVGSAKRHEKFDYIPSTKTLYNWIDEGKLTVKNIDLEMKLRRSTKGRKSRKNKKMLGTSIEERPESIETREEFGHWEIDTVLGHKSKDDALLTLVERNTRNTIIRRLSNKSSQAVTEAMNDIFSEYLETNVVFKSITADNGSEFSELSNQGNEFHVDVYFAHPYASWERGSNERHNGLIRRFIKKGQPINTYTDEQIADVEEWMNTLPRKILDYQTPAEAFAVFVDCVA